MTSPRMTYSCHSGRSLLHREARGLCLGESCEYPLPRRHTRVTLAARSYTGRRAASASGRAANTLSPAAVLPPVMTSTAVARPVPPPPPPPPPFPLLLFPPGRAT